MIVEPDFLTHWKTQMLVAELGDPAAPLYVIALWAHCQQRRTAQFDQLADNALKAICRYPGDGAKLRAALEVSGFIDPTETGFNVHGWDEVNAKLIANWDNGGKGGRPKKSASVPSGKTQPEPTGNPNQTHRNPQGTDRQEKIEKIEERGGKDSAGAPPAVAVEPPPPPVSNLAILPPAKAASKHDPTPGRTAVEQKLRELWPDAPRHMTAMEMHDLSGSLSVLCELTDEDWAACSAWNAAPLRLLGKRSRWPRDRREFIAHAGEVIEIVRPWWRAGGRSWHARQVAAAAEPPERLSAPAPSTPAPTDEDIAAFAEFLKTPVPLPGRPGATASDPPATYPQCPEGQVLVGFSDGAFGGEPIYANPDRISA
ncbi:MAG: hypothetical protein JWO82_2410 [Akkermansiaceae bacterium]|nr:hypothetical protein [Akkermansiaceae bacterium]